MRSPITASAAVAISIALAMALGACALLPSRGPAPTPTPTGESVSAACEALESEVDEVKSEMQQAAEILNTKTDAAAQLLSVAAFRLNYMAEEEIHNDEVVEVTTAVSESISALSELLTEAADDPANADAEAIDAAGDDVNAAFDAFAQVCPSDDSDGDACDELKGEAAAVSSELSEASELLSADETAAAAKLAAAAARFEEAAAAVEDAEVSELATDLSASLNRFSGLINALAADPDHPDQAALSAGSDELNAAFTALAQGCAW